MPANAANRMTIFISPNVDSGGIPLNNFQARRFGMSDGRKTGATAEIRNPDNNGASSVDLSLRFQKAGTALKKSFVWAATPASGTFKFTFNGLESAAIAYNAAASAVKTALTNLRSLNGYIIEVVGTGVASPGYTVTLMPKAPTGTFGGTKSFGPPLDQALTVNAVQVQNLYVSTNAVLDGSSVVRTCTETDLTWTNVDPDGYNAAIVVKPMGKKFVAFGQGADENNADNTLGPYFRIVCTAGQGMIEFSPSDETLNVFKV